MGSPARPDDRLERLGVPLLAGAYCLYLWLQDPSLYFEGAVAFPPFLAGAAYARPFFTYPGGPLDYLAAALLQYLSARLLGALLITLFAVGLGLCVDRLTRSLSGSGAGWRALTPAALLLVLYHQLGYHGADVLGAAFALAAATAYASLRARQPAYRAGAFALISIALYLLLGPPYLLFVGLAAVVEIRVGARRLPGLLYLLSGEAVPQFIGVWLLQGRLYDAFEKNTPFDVAAAFEARLALGALWLLLLLLAVGAARRDTARPAAAPSHPRRLLSAALVALLLVAPAVLASRSRGAIVLRVSQELLRGNYEQVLRVARERRVPRPPGEMVFATDYALYHLGLLGEEMFHFPQNPEGLVIGMICGPGLSPPTVRIVRYSFPFQSGRVLFDLGLIDQAEAGACEALEGYGPHTRTLGLLAQVNLAKGRPETARGFLAALARSPARRNRARAALARLQSAPEQAADETTQTARARMLRTETGAYVLNLEQQCLALLRSNPRNRMAFEYLLSYYLLNRQLDKFAPLVERLPDLGYTAVPRHWQEALALNEARTGRPPELPGYRLDPTVAAEFGRFSEIMAPLQRGDPRLAQQAVQEPFGNTYYYYYVFGVSGEGRQ